jgi:hypothetical protein
MVSLSDVTERVPRHESATHRDRYVVAVLGTYLRPPFGLGVEKTAWPTGC